MLSGIPPFEEQCGGLFSALLGPMTDLEGANVHMQNIHLRQVVC